jgi:hypothetical protein
MTQVSGYLTAAAERCALPVSVRMFYVDAGPNPVFVIGNHSETQPFTYGSVYTETFDTAEATAAYLRLCAELTESRRAGVA